DKDSKSEVPRKSNILLEVEECFPRNKPQVLIPARFNLIKCGKMCDVLQPRHLDYPSLLSLYI
ncbi:hypothetical protein J6590_098394, partial [Homalodisca vitripennis]